MTPYKTYFSLVTSNFTPNRPSYYRGCYYKAKERVIIGLYCIYSQITMLHVAELIRLEVKKFRNNFFSLSKTGI